MHGFRPKRGRPARNVVVEVKRKRRVPAKAAPKAVTKTAAVPTKKYARRILTLADVPKHYIDEANTHLARKAETKKKTRKGTKLELVKQLLTRRQGTTIEEILVATGWPSISVPAYAKRLGLELEKYKENGKRHKRYFGVAA